MKIRNRHKNYYQRNFMNSKFNKQPPSFAPGPFYLVRILKASQVQLKFSIALKIILSSLFLVCFSPAHAALTDACKIGQWTGIVGTLSGDEPPEATGDMISGGVMRIPPSLSSDGYYWTRFRLAIPSNLSGDNARLEVKLKDPDSEGGIGAYDTSLWIAGNGDGVTDKSAGVVLMGDSWGQYWDGLYAVDSNVTQIPELVIPLDDWHTIAIESKGGMFSVYNDNVKIKDLAYSGQIGAIKYIEIDFKGSGSIDDVKLYEKGTLVLHDNFDSVSSAQFSCNITPNSFRGEQKFKNDSAMAHLNVGEYRYYYFPKQAKSNTVVDLTVTTGNCDLYGYAALAKPSDIYINPHSKSTNVSGNEQFSFMPTKQGYYYVLVKAETACDFSPPTVNNKAIKLVSKHTISLDKESTIGIISTGTMDLQGMLLTSNGDYVTDLDHADHISHNYETFKPYKKGVTPATMTATNFMITAGDENGVENLTKRRVLPAGNYDLLVSPDVDAKGKPALDTAQYGVLVLKRPEVTDSVPVQSNDFANDFFTGLNLLLGDGDTANDYMDIYVRSLYPHLVGTNWGNTVAFLNVPKERQCKAVNNFHLQYVLNNGGYMNTDTAIRAKWKNDEGFSLLGGTGNGRGIIIYNSYSKLNDLGVIHRGDVFAKNRGTYNHYGLYFEDSQLDATDSESTQIIDANGSGDGKLHIVPASIRRADLYVKNSWKVARPTALQ